MKIKLLLSIFVLLALITCGLFYFGSTSKKNTHSQALPITQTVSEVKTIAQSTNETNNASDAKWLNQKIEMIKPQAKNLNVNVLKLSLTAYQKAQERGVIHNPLITIIDYSKPSAERRLWVIDLDKNKVLFNTLVAHGKNSGTASSDSFSNRHNSLKSSIGVFVTNETYQGKHGNSLKVQGLESGINDNAYDRSIVFHGAKYVSSAIAASGKIGRSWGCMAVDEDVIGPLIKTIKNKTLVVSYYPDQKWLNNSKFLN